MRTWTKEEIADLINTSDRAVCHALLALYNRQTADEQVSEATVVHNNQGFRGCDARFMTSVAKGYLKYGRLSSKQLASVRKHLTPYVGQLTKIANGVI